MGSSTSRPCENAFLSTLSCKHSCGEWYGWSDKHRMVYFVRCVVKLTLLCAGILTITILPAWRRAHSMHSSTSRACETAFLFSSSPACFCAICC
jgi:hypothetical protein